MTLREAKRMAKQNARETLECVADGDIVSQVLACIDRISMGHTRLHCSLCGAVVSKHFPDDGQLRAGITVICGRCEAERAVILAETQKGLDAARDAINDIANGSFGNIEKRRANKSIKRDELEPERLELEHSIDRLKAGDSPTF